ncbi:MAG: hypothetical protein H0T80_04960 [Betaproteobacteria bacterium]|nr:hypothetical protein [Betaproteobacteria bacterium]
MAALNANAGHLGRTAESLGISVSTLRRNRMRYLIRYRPESRHLR